MDSNGTESTEIEEDAQEDPELKSPTPTSASELKSPDIEISSPRSTNSVSFYITMSRPPLISSFLGTTADQYAAPSAHAV